MNLIQSINESVNKAAAQEQLNQAVIAGDEAKTKSAMRVLVSAVGAKMAQMMLDHAHEAVAEKNARANKKTVGVAESVEFGSNEAI